MVQTAPASKPRVFELFLIKPSHYDDEGYVIQWLRSSIPSNTLATLYGLALDCAERRVLGDGRRDPDHRLGRDQHPHPARRDHPADPRTRRARAGRPRRRADQPVPARRRHRPAAARRGHPGLHRRVPRQRLHRDAAGHAAGAARGDGPRHHALRRRGGGAAATSCCSAADRRRAEAALQLHERSAGAGGRADAVPAGRTSCARTAGMRTSFDAGRGCPFLCSFCTIINVQGRKSRARSADDVERLVRANLAQGVHNFFITDDNLARNQNWEAIFDRLIDMREEEGERIYVVAQVDTMAHKIRGFIEKAGARRRQPRVHRPGEHQPGRAQGRAEGPEPHHRVPRDAAGVAPRGRAHLSPATSSASRATRRPRSSATSASSSASCRSISSSSSSSRRCPAPPTTRSCTSRACRWSAT